MADSLQTDFLISGGGPVGLILAIGLARQGHQVIVAESQKPAWNQRHAEAADEAQTANAFDGRVLALSYGSVRLLQSLEIWPGLQKFATRISDVHVSQKGFLGVTTLSAQEAGVPALGFSVQGQDLGLVLWQEAEKYDNIRLLSPVSLTTFTQLEESSRMDNVLPIEAVLKSDAQEAGVQTVQCKCLIGADGTQSQVRQQMGLKLHTKDYHAFGILARIETRQHPNGLAFERFTRQGPVALLPMDGYFHKAVWVCPQEQKDTILALDDEAYMQAFSDRMGARLGGFVSVSKRLAYPLKETSLDEISRGSVVLMGNAAHTQHPVAAQGLNLGIADIDEFLTMLDELDINDRMALEAVIASYAHSRQQHHAKVMGMTDGLINLFQNKSQTVGHLRGLGLMAMQALPPLKKRFARFAMGAKS